MKPMAHRPSRRLVAPVVRRKKKNKSLTVLATVVGIVFGAFAVAHALIIAPTASGRHARNWIS